MHAVDLDQVQIRDVADLDNAGKGPLYSLTMGEREINSEFADNFDLEKVITDLRKEIELLHSQQSYLQMQITSFVKGVEIEDETPDGVLKKVRNFLATVIKKNKYLYRIVFNIRRYFNR